MLKGLELIVQYPDQGGGYFCRGFRGLRLSAPAYAVFDGEVAHDQKVAHLLGDSFCSEVLRFPGVQEETGMPCLGKISAIDCHATKEPTCLKIHVRPAASSSAGISGSFASPAADVTWKANCKLPTWQVVSILPSGTNVSLHVPAWADKTNACLYKSTPIEAVWPLMQRIGITPEENRLFISYVRNDTAPIADQLFANLTQSGFDVFLDRCSVPVGVQFQKHLSQDLCDKAVVVFLNSAQVSNSSWVDEELFLIKSYRLGILELRFPGASVITDLHPDCTIYINNSDLEPVDPSKTSSGEKLTPATVDSIIQQVHGTHVHALHRRRYQLIDNFAAALSAAGRAAQILPDGSFILPSVPGRTGAAVGLVARSPELHDYCALHLRGGVSAVQKGWLISPAPFFLAEREAQVTWLDSVSNIQHVNESQLTALARSI
jgi:TIR domain